MRFGLDWFELILLGAMAYALAILVIVTWLIIQLIGQM